MQVVRPINNFVQVFIGPQVAAIVLLALLSSTYVYLYTKSEPQVSEAPHVAQFVQTIECTNKLEYENSHLFPERGGV